MKKRHHKARTEFSEESGIFFEKMGFPRVAGKIWGWLLTSDPSHQSAGDIADAVRVSRGSISTMTRLLMQMGLIERVGLPGQRSGFYRVKSGGFTEMLRMKMQFTTEIRRIAEHGLEMLKGESVGVRSRLQEYRDLCIFFEKELPALIEKWQKQRDRIPEA
jgi:DNA-binding transcriptional regulator GbsR (MarR family)